MQSFTSLIRHSGNRELFDFLELSVLAQLAGFPLHLHAEGLRGTGKTTIIRGIRSALPAITRIKGCLYNCHPDKPHCPDHKSMDRETVRALGVEQVVMPFLEISASAKMGTVVGTIDLEKITDPQRPEAALLPGTIPQAHRGIIFIDEINRLADTSPELADVLLDVMGTKPGRLQIEESGLSRRELTVQVSVWAASNPDEDPGPLENIRRQLSDRFDFLLEMGRPSLPGEVAQVLALNCEDTRFSLSEDDCSLQEQLAGAAGLLPNVVVDKDTRQILAELYTRFNLESLRAVEAIQQGARVHAARQGQDRVVVEDLLAVARPALRHRTDPSRLTEIVEYLRSFSLAQERKTRAAAVLLDSGPGKRESKGDKGFAPRENPGRWQRLWQRLYLHLQRFLPGRRAGAGGEGGNNRQKGGRTGISGGTGKGARAGQAVQGNADLADPRQTPINSPPYPARSLLELSTEGMVLTGDRKQEYVVEG